MNRTGVLVVILTAQMLAAAVFIASLASSVLGVAPVAWAVYELTEIGAGIAMMLGTVLGTIVLGQSLIRTREVEAKLRVTSGAFMNLLEERFASWGLTPAEREVAIFAIERLSSQEIAQIRQTSEGTVKAQMAAIYHKAAVTRRPQLLSPFIEELMAGPLLPQAKEEQGSL